MEDLESMPASTRISELVKEIQFTIDDPYFRISRNRLGYPSLV